MENSINVKVDLSQKYPVYKREGERLVELTARNPGRRYSLSTNVQTGETYYLEFTDEEEQQADMDKSAWDAAAPDREAKEREIMEEAKKFEASLQYKNRIVAFVDILGWKQAVLSKGEHVVKMLGKALANLQSIANHYNSLNGLLLAGEKWPGDLLITQFSDCLVLSAEDEKSGRDALEDALHILSSTLIEFGFLLRGGVVRGDIYHDARLVYGPALIESYELESRFAVVPRIILSPELSGEWGGAQVGRGVPWIPGGDGYLFFNFLPPFFGNPFLKNEALWRARLNPIRELILGRAGDPGCTEGVYSKYRWLASYFDRVCDDCPNFGLERVAHLAERLRVGGGV